MVILVPDARAGSGRAQKASAAVRAGAARHWPKLGLLSASGLLASPLFLEEGLLSLAWRQGLSTLAFDHGPVALGFGFAAGALALAGMAQGGRTVADLPPQADIFRAVDIVSRQPNAAAGLVRLGDKSLLFSECGEAFIMYARQGRSMIALFDPVGPRHAWEALALCFMAEAKALGCRPVFYQVSPEFLPIVTDARFKALKLGEQAVIDLSRFSLEGGRWLKLRRNLNRAERDGLTFEFIDAQNVPALLSDLAAVSEAWLAEQNAGEKGFSLGVFKPDYVTAEPVAVIRLEGRIVAFANILTSASGSHAFVDLMRHAPGVHRGVMDLLFVRLMEHLRDRGFRSLNLGMAPLAGLLAEAQTPIWSRIGGQVFEKGERFYNFRGVREFKAKFDPDWQPRYLAAPDAGFPIASLLDVTLLIGGGLKSVLKK